MLRKKNHSLLSFFLLLLALQTPVAYAANKMYCSMYVKNAVAQNKQSIENNCNYKGIRWSSDVAHHTQWCLNASNESAENENLARIVQLAKCQVKILPVGADSWCNIYSRVSIGQNMANLSTQCGFSGPSWSSDYGQHYRWCSGVSQERANSQITARQNQLLNGCNK